MEAIQMNTRIDRLLKEEGDEAFARVGWTPSQAVRMLWAFAAAHSRDPEAIRQALAPDGSGNSDAAVARRKRVQAALAGPAICTEGLRRWGIDVAGGDAALLGVAGLSDDELRECALLERLAERGLA